jgi:tRNA A-37 threonylcarbamoyl transferase component Bud32
MDVSMDEKNITKGNISEVFRVGTVVYRDLKPQSKTIHRLLLHLETKGIDFVPRFLGLDENKLEMLSFVEGETIEDYPAQADMESKIHTVQQAAKMLRVFHDATIDFDRRPDDTWFLTYEGELLKEVICHNDFAPYNVTFQDFHPVGMIDFDTSCPAPRIWDVAYAVYRFIPLSAQVYDPIIKEYRKYDKVRDYMERKLLLQTFIKSYGIGGTLEVLQNVIMRLQVLVELFDKECRNGNVAFVRMRAEGHQQYYIDEITFIKENMHDWL